MTAPQSSARSIIQRRSKEKAPPRSTTKRPWTAATTTATATTTSKVLVPAGWCLLTTLIIALCWYALGAQQSTPLLFSDPVAALVRQRRNENPRPFRVFGPSPPTGGGGEARRLLADSYNNNNDNTLFSFRFYTRQEQRDFLVDFGSFCQRGFTSNKASKDDDDEDNNSNVLLRSFDSLPEAYGAELWKYCLLYTGIETVYWDGDNLTPLVTWEDLLLSSSSAAANTKPSTNVAIRIEQQQDTSGNGRSSSSIGEDFEDDADVTTNSGPPRFHHGFLQVTKAKSKVCAGMMRWIVETPPDILDPVRLSEVLGLHVMDNNNSGKSNEWQIWSARCLWTGQHEEPDFDKIAKTSSTTATSSSVAIPPSSLSSARRKMTAATRCPMSNGGHCCQVWLPEAPDVRWAAMAIRDPYLAVAPTDPNSSSTTGSSGLVEPPNRRHHPYVDTLDEKELGMPASDLPFIATVSTTTTEDTNTEAYETPNFFDILVENNCLPEGRECFRCLKKQSSPSPPQDKQDSGGGDGDNSMKATPEATATNDCHRCQDICPCYCRTLCKIRPPPKRVVAEWRVRLPPLRKDPSRLVPRIIHQTWYEPITEEKYPNMSRLIEGFKQSGWQYNFYDDESAAQFLSTHFPPEVREAYDSILPGAFKADLFRYCVLLITGGIYFDMDVILQSNLDAVLDGGVGFMTAQDEPGLTVGHRSCLWNGLLAAAPGHPFLMRTIENVVNNIRNRFTSVDYDDMLCPDPVLSVAHTSDMLFTCGPCILGASINDVLKRHRQHSFEYGDIDLFETERLLQQRSKGDGSGGSDTIAIDIDPADPRLLVPGRSVLLKQDKGDMGAHRFTWVEANLVVASTDLPDSDDRPKSLVHYSKAREKFGIYGVTKLYTDDARANEEIRIRIE